MKGSDETGAFGWEIRSLLLQMHWNGSGCAAFSVRVEVPHGLG
jgi:hypothetical protein